jgi:AcrR family transcriptional regulator
MHPIAIREKAIKLRTEQGMTIDQLAEHLGLSRTTIYAWVRGIPIVRQPRDRAPRRLGNSAMQAAFRRKREAAYAQGADEFAALCSEAGFRDFVCMYIGEGYKRSRSTVSLANSDPAVVMLAARWIQRFAKNPVWYAVQYHADQDLDELRRFWSQLLSVPPDAIRLQRKSNSSGLAGRRWRSRHGVLTVGSNDTLFRSRLQAWIDRVEESWL